MKWIELASGKQPKFAQYVYLYDEKGDAYSAGWLKEVKESVEGKVCVFAEAGQDAETSDFTHFAVPTPPKKKA